MSTASVLIVEDEAIIAADLECQLTQLGYKVVGSIARGEDAIALARTVRPSLVMMDIRLAGDMDGIQAALAIRRETASPVVFLSAHCDTVTLERAGLAEAFGYILKPFETRDLRVQIEMALRKHAAEQRLVAENAHLEGQIKVIEHALDRTQEKLRGIAADLIARRPAPSTAAFLDAQPPEGPRAEALASQKLPVPTSPELATSQLTQRQLQVLGLIAEGHAGKSIATVLGISPKTVEYHKAALMKQLRLRSTAELTRYAIKHGLVTAD